MPRQSALEGVRVAGMPQERLGNEEGVFGIVAYHAAAVEQSMSPRAGHQPSASARRKPFGRQAQGVADSRSKHDANHAIVHGFLAIEAHALLRLSGIDGCEAVSCVLLRPVTSGRTLPTGTSAPFTRRGRPRKS